MDVKLTMRKSFIPNCITVFRIAFSSLLLFAEPLSIAFFIVYYAAGLTDILDGYLARKLHSESKTGEILDSFADVVFVACIVICLRNFFVFPTWIWWWIGAIAVAKTIVFLAIVVKTKGFFRLHHPMNKICGAMLYVFVPIVFKCYNNGAIAMLCGIATIALLFDIMECVFAKTSDKNVKIA